MASDQAFKPALLVVDMQEDFCPPKGSLAVAGGRDIAAGINRLLEAPFPLKVATQDWHPSDHKSFATNHKGPNNKPFADTAPMTNPANPSETRASSLWPAHCIQNTPGAEIISELDASHFDKVVHKGMDPNVEMYSAFNDIFGNGPAGSSGVSMDLAAYFMQHGITHVYVCGLTGDLCVYENALGARKYGFEVVFLKDLTRAVAQGQFEEALRTMQRRGVVVAESTGKEVLRVVQESR